MDEQRDGRRQGSTPGPQPTRRTVLAGATGTVALVAGCADSESDDADVADPQPIDDEASEESDAAADDEEGSNGASDGDDEPAEPADDDSESDPPEADDEDDEADDGDEGTDEPAIDHPSAANMAHSPVLGPEPTDGEATVIMFDDPSCPACAYFEATTFPDLRDHAEAGELSIVWRGISVIEEWSGAALQVLWATYERDVDAFWELREHTFEIQEAMGSDEEAVDRLLDYLADATSLDIEAIRSEAEDRAYEERPTLDEDAGRGAGIDATPYFFLFRDGEFRTEIRGVEDYRVFASTLELSS